MVLSKETISFLLNFKKWKTRILTLLLRLKFFKKMNASPSNQKPRNLHFESNPNKTRDVLFILLCAIECEACYD